MLGVVLRNQRFRIGAYGTCECADMAAGVHVAAAAGEVVLLDRVHDGDAHPGGRADLFDRETCGDTSLLEHSTDRRPVVFGGVADGHGGAFRA